jgi:hypothetical protein
MKNRTRKTRIRHGIKGFDKVKIRALRTVRRSGPIRTIRVLKNK